MNDLSQRHTGILPTLHSAIHNNARLVICEQPDLPLWNFCAHQTHFQHHKNGARLSNSVDARANGSGVQV